MKRTSTSSSRGVDRRFARVVAAFARDRQVTRGGKGFGSTGLKVNGKLFAMVSGRTGAFVAKLSKERVEELVRAGQGRPFDPGHGRLMKEWVEVDDEAADWVALAREARAFVGGGKP
jgi:hypothetical protein